jgi:uncharacterized protein
VFVDASGWLAAISRRDQSHEPARAVVESCLDGQIAMVTTNWTVHEALSLLKSRDGVGAASTLWSMVNNPDVVRFVLVSEDLERRGLDLFFGYADKGWGVVDCTSIVVMEETGCTMALGFDRHFVEAGRQRGFRVLP